MLENKICFVSFSVSSKISMKTGPLVMCLYVNASLIEIGKIFGKSTLNVLCAAEVRIRYENSVLRQGVKLLSTNFGIVGSIGVEYSTSEKGMGSSQTVMEILFMPLIKFMCNQVLRWFNSSAGMSLLLKKYRVKKSLEICLSIYKVATNNRIQKT